MWPHGVAAKRLSAELETDGTGSSDRMLSQDAARPNRRTQCRLALRALDGGLLLLDAGSTKCLF